MNQLFLLLALIICSAAYAEKRHDPANGPEILHARNGLPNFFQKLKGGQPVTIAYLGGSITAAPGYRVQTEQWLRKQYPNSKIRAINAGVGGTGSDLGVFRLQEDVLKYDPDLVFVEFAVNDGRDSLTVCQAMEGIVRQIKKQNAHTDICFLYTVSEPMVKELQQGNVIRSVRYTENVAQYYGLPSINLSVDVLDLLAKDALVFHGQKGNDYGTRTVFTYDGVHPTVAGHTVYTGTITKAFGEMENIKGATAATLKGPLYAGRYDQTALYSPAVFKKTKGWKSGNDRPDLKNFARAFPDMVYSDNPQDSIVIRFKGRAIGGQDIIGPTSGGVLITIDGKQTIRKARFDKYGVNNRRTYFLLDSLPDGEHTVVFKPDPSPINKMKIAGTAVLKDTTSFKANYLYIGKIMVAGELLQ